MAFKPLLFFCVLLSFSCNNPSASSANKLNINKNAAANLTSKNPFHTITAIPLPSGFVRVNVINNSFAGWLRNIVLKENKTVYLFDGRIKTNQLAQFAVMDISVGNKNLQQCADAVMRLRAEYLFSEKNMMKLFLQIMIILLTLLNRLIQNIIWQNLWKGFLACVAQHLYQSN